MMLCARAVYDPSPSHRLLLSCAWIPWARVSARPLRLSRTLPPFSPALLLEFDFSGIILRVFHSFSCAVRGGDLWVRDLHPAIRNVTDEEYRDTRTIPFASLASRKIDWLFWHFFEIQRCFPWCPRGAQAAGRSAVDRVCRVAPSARSRPRVSGLTFGVFINSFQYFGYKRGEMRKPTEIHS